MLNIVCPWTYVAVLELHRLAQISRGIAQLDEVEQNSHSLKKGP